MSSVSTIDTNGFGATWSGALSGDGALVKAGDGALIFDAANTYTGGTQIAAGTLRLGTGGSLAATGALQIDDRDFHDFFRSNRECFFIQHFLWMHSSIII